MHQFTGMAFGCPVGSPSPAPESGVGPAEGLPQGVAGGITTAQEHSTAPPESNTGAQTTLTQLDSNQASPLDALIDYFRVTFPDGSFEPEEFLDWWGGREAWSPLPYGPRGYSQAFGRAGILVAWGGKRGQGIHVEAKGEGCRQLEAEGIVKDWSAFLAVLLAFGGKFGRLDVALDDREGLLQLETVSSALWVGRAEQRDTHRPTDKDGNQLGHTVYFGSRQSDTFVRIYDKALEQQRKGHQVEGHWVRCELELKRKRAHAMAQAIAQGDLGTTAAGVLRATLRFVERGTHQDRDRWPVCAWWDRFLGGVQAVRLGIGKPQRTIEKMLAWVGRQVSTSLATLTEYHEGDLDWLMGMIVEGRRRMRAHHRALLKPATALEGGT